MRDALYGLGRFVIEGMRTDQLVLCTIGETAIPVSQVVAILFMMVAVILFVVGRKRKENAYFLEEDDSEGESL